jgi:hypothetical protein
VQIASCRRAVARYIVSLLSVLALAPTASGLTFVSGFNGDLTSTIGVGGVWEVPPADPPGISIPAPVFVPSLTEGTQAVQVANDPVNGSWPALLLINGGVDLANIIGSNRTLVFEVAPSADMDTRDVLAVLNTDLDWVQTADDKYKLTPPDAAHPFTRIAVDMTDVALGWKAHAQAWIAGAQHEYFELGIILLGSDLSGNLPLTTIDNVRFLAADFNPDENLDLAAEGVVNAADLAIWKSGFSLDATGDADNDGDTDGVDFLTWQREVSVAPTPGAAAVPEPAALAMAAVAMACLGMARRRGR